MGRFRYAIFALLLIPLADALLLAYVASAVLDWTLVVLLVVLTALLGMLFVRAEGRHTMRKIQQALAEGRAPTDELIDGGMLIAAGAFLLTSFYFNGTTFLGFAILAEKRRMQTSARGVKSLYFTGGILEGTETIAFFVLICLVPQWFAPAAWIFGTLCFATAASRILLARRAFPPDDTATRSR